jgi:hypothetical protein
MRLEGGEFPRYLFRLISTSLRVISFEVDFTGSLNCDYYQDSKLLKEYVISRKIDPSEETQTTMICVVVLRENWKLKTKFKFSLQNPSKEL